MNILALSLRVGNFGIYTVMVGKYHLLLRYVSTIEITSTCEENSQNCQFKVDDFPLVTSLVLLFCFAPIILPSYNQPPTPFSLPSVPPLIGR